MKYSTKEQIDSSKKWRKANPKMAKALNQVQSYKNMDRRNGFGDVIDFDARWMVENIYTKPCIHCGETDWHKLGCNRLDNSKPHTKDNVEPCCWGCNNKLGRIYTSDKMSKPIAQHNLETGELIYVWKNAYAIEKQNGWNHHAIAKCCKGEYKQAYGFKWYYAPYLI